MTTLDERTPRLSKDDINADLGFGSVVARESRRRLLNRDGTFNVGRESLRFWRAEERVTPSLFDSAGQLRTA